MTKIEPIPYGYHLSGDLFDDFDDLPARRWLLIGNLWALLPLAIAILILWLPYQFYAALGAPLALLPDPRWSSLINWIFGALVVLGSMILHERLHGLALMMLGYHAKFNFSSGYFYATTDGYLTRHHYVIMVLTPITIMTLGGALVLLFLPVSIGQIVLIALLLNAAASIGDLAVAQRALRQPADALFADRGGIKIFLRETFDHAKNL
jgi:hypothetical protein